MNEKQLTFEGVMRIVQGNKWILLKDIERLEKFIQNQQATIQSLKEENEQLRNELQFYDKIINFFASNPMTKYSSKADLIEEMTLLEKMGVL